MRPRPHGLGDLDYLRGLADKQGEVLVERLAGLSTPARATLVRMRWNPAGHAGELTLEVGSDSELAILLGQIHARGGPVDEMTIVPNDYAAMIELREVSVMRIEGDRDEGTVFVNLNFPWRQA